MSKSLAAAQKAAIDGLNEEWDTQACEAIQNEFLSSSPVLTPTIASTNPVPRAIPLLGQVPTNNTEVEGDVYEDLEDKGPDGQELKTPELPATTNNPTSSPRLPNDADAVIYKRNDKGRIRPYYRNSGKEVQQPEEKLRRRHQTVMDDLALDSSQKSAVSLTQANSASVYEQFERPHIDYPVNVNADSLHSRYASAHTESTGVTYEEGDDRHIKLDFNPEESQESLPNEEDGDIEESQDNYTAPQAEMTSQFEPQTPTAPINPFTRQGSVMQGAELFGATQPSSIGRHFATPGSARPSSPNMYNSVSPQKRRRVASMSSVTGAGIVGDEDEDEGGPETSPVKSSARALVHSVSMDSPLAPVPRTTSMARKSVYEPRPYQSMAASQEKRSMKFSSPESSDSDDGFDKDIPAAPKRRDSVVDKILASVELRKKIPQTSSTPAAVEVPSTRRRSVEEEYIAQCSGHDARDTQQADETQTQDEMTEEIIADSQALPALPEVSSVPIVQSSEPFLTAQSQSEDVNRENSSPRLVEPSHSREPGTPEPKPANNLTIPETSPSNGPATPDSPTNPASPEDYMRPMGTIASFTQGTDDDEFDYGHMAGFTQDVEFDNIRRMDEGDFSPITSKVMSLPRNLLNSTIKPLAPFRETDNFQDVNNTAANDGPVTPVFAIPAVLVRAEIQNPAESKTASPIMSSVGSAVSSALSEMDTPPRPTNFFGPDLSQDATPSPTTESIASDHAKAATETSLNKANSEHDDEIPLPRMSKTSDHSPSPRVAKDNEETNHAVEEERALSPRDDGIEVSQDDAADDDAGSESEVQLPKHKAKVHESKLAKTPSSKKEVAKPKAPPPTRSAKKTSAASLRRVATAGASTTPASSPLQNMITPDPINSAASRRTSRRSNAATPVRGPLGPTRASKRQSTMRESSEDPLALGISTSSFVTGTALFSNMAFAISYVSPDNGRDAVVKLITENGGTILKDGFDVLFESESSKGDASKLRLSAPSKDLGFTALIADEHSRKAKFMHALALGLPCVSGYWISACVAQGRVLDWAPYLLCAGMSSILHATKSRMLSPYSADTARLEEIITSRDQLLKGKNVLFVAGKTKAEVETRRAYTFLTRVLGPALVTRVGDLREARQKLAEGDEEYDMLYVDVNKERADKVVFGDASSASAPKGKGKKRKRGKEEDEVAMGPPPKKKIRIIVDETMVQSLIMGQFLDDALMDV